MAQVLGQPGWGLLFSARSWVGRILSIIPGAWRLGAVCLLDTAGSTRVCM